MNQHIEHCTLHTQIYDIYINCISCLAVCLRISSSLSGPEKTRNENNSVGRERAVRISICEMQPKQMSDHSEKREEQERKIHNNNKNYDRRYVMNKRASRQNWINVHCAVPHIHRHTKMAPSYTNTLASLVIFFLFWPQFCCSLSFSSYLMIILNRKMQSMCEIHKMHQLLTLHTQKNGLHHNVSFICSENVFFFVLFSSHFIFRAQNSHFFCAWAREWTQASKHKKEDENKTPNTTHTLIYANQNKKSQMNK